MAVVVWLGVAVATAATAWVALRPPEKQRLQAELRKLDAVARARQGMAIQGAGECQGLEVMLGAGPAKQCWDTHGLILEADARLSERDDARRAEIERRLQELP